WGADPVSLLRTRRPGFDGRNQRRRRIPSCSSGRGPDLGVGVDIPHPRLDQLGTSGPLPTARVGRSPRATGSALGRWGTADALGFVDLGADRRSSIGTSGGTVRGERWCIRTRSVPWRYVVRGSWSGERFLDGSFRAQSFGQRTGHLSRICGRGEPSGRGAVGG